jgi:hypothetical protein
LLVTAGLWAIVPNFGNIRNTAAEQSSVSGVGDAGSAVLVTGAILLAVSQVLRLRDRRRANQRKARKDEHNR